MPNILIVEDDEDVRNFYSDALTNAGFDVTQAEDADSALQHFNAEETNLVLLDIAMHGDSEAGFRVCTEIRTLSDQVPIIFLTSLDSDIDKISGIRLGADDYITKNISIDYLVVRIKTLLHRFEVLTGKNTPPQANELVRGNLCINMDTLTIKWKDTLVPLNLTQLWMVHLLASNQGYVCTTQQLMNAAKITIQSATVVVQINIIRQLFQNVDKDFISIKTERGLGYRWMDAS